MVVFEDAVCVDPTYSVLLDGEIQLTGLEGDTWARDLFTLQSSCTTNSTPLSLRFDFSKTLTFSGIGRIEVVLFQCPEWGIHVDSISIIIDDVEVASESISLSSCDSLVRVCLKVGIQEAFPIIYAVFSCPANLTIVQAHIAEVTFYDNSSVCPVAEEIITITEETTPTSTTDITTTGSAMTSQAFIISTSFIATIALGSHMM